MQSSISFGPYRGLLGCLTAGIFAVVSTGQVVKADGPFEAGVYAKSINPESFPVWVNGGIAAAQADRINDPLHARCLVIGDGQKRVAICIVDNCILPIELVDQARELTSKRTSIPPENILIAATHAHSAVSVAGVHGSPVQEDYAAKLPTWIAEGIEEATKRMVPAQWGTSSVVCDKYIYCRRWMMKPGKATNVPFTGRTENQVVMNPGFDNPDKLAPVGPVDTLIPILSIQTREGKGLAVLSSFSTHYAGAKAISADYFAVVCEKLAQTLRPEDPSSFMGLMANATSGDANCIDFSKPREPFTHVEVGRFVADRILSAIPNIRYSDRVDLETAFETLNVAARMPTADEVKEAEQYVATHLQDRLPKTMIENYARETVLMSQLPKTRDLRLQVLRLNDFAIVANPCESYAATGLKIRQASPYSLTMNIGLANGHGGYIPPPEHFQLGGYTTWRARSSCLEEYAEPKMVERLTALMQKIDPNRSVSKKVSGVGEGTGYPQIPPSPIEPEESLKWMQVDPGYRVRLVASEPQVIDPVAMQIDDAGRLWAVEMRDYPVGTSEGGSTGSGPSGIGRVVILEDLNGDGQFEKSTTFADKLLYPTGIQLWKEGAFVTAAGELLYLRDSDGDLVAETRETVLKGFEIGNSQLRANHPSIGMDGWLYVANGLRGGKLEWTRNQNPSSLLDLAGKDMRMHLRESRIEGVTGPSQFGLTWDPYGHRYGVSNRQPCIEAVLEQSDISLSPLAGLVPAWTNAAPAEVESSVRPLVAAWTTSNLHAGQFTAACGVLVTNSNQLPSTSWGHVLTCEPTGSLVQRRSLKRENGRTSVADKSPEREWLASRDPWFRPVNLIEGPEGIIYVVDMYRAVIEHPEWVPKELKKRPDERFGDQQGRIYCVEKVDANRSKGTMRLSQCSNDELVAMLESEFAWTRNTAARLLLERADTRVGGSLRSLARGSKLPETRIHASGLLGYFQAWDLETALALVQESDSRVRAAAWRWIREQYFPSSSELRRVAIEALKSKDVDEVRNACWYLAGQTDFEKEWVPIEIEQLLTEATKAAASLSNDGYSLMALSAACRNHKGKLLKDWIASMEKSASEGVGGKDSVGKGVALGIIAEQAIVRLSQSLSEEEGVELRKYLAEAKGTMQEDRLRFPIRCAVVEGLAISGRKPNQAIQNSDLEWIIHVIGSDNRAIAQRAKAMRLLKFSVSEKVAAILFRFLQSDELEIRKAALAASVSHRSKEISDWLIEQFAKGEPETRNELFHSIRGRSERLESLLQGIEAKQIPLKILDAAQRQSLKSVADPKLKARFTAIFDAALNPDRDRVVKKYELALQTKGHLEQGKGLFAKNCAACHRIDGVGYSVGPDISDARDQTYEKLLVSLLDPNRSIDANFFRYVALTDEGEVVEGLLRESNSETILLRGQNGKETLLNRSEIAELKSTGVSMMPEGIEEQVSIQQMADLLFYIKNWRYDGAKVPAEAALGTR